MNRRLHVCWSVLWAKALIAMEGRPQSCLHVWHYHLGQPSRAGQEGPFQLNPMDLDSMARRLLSASYFFLLCYVV